MHAFATFFTFRIQNSYIFLVYIPFGAADFINQNGKDVNNFRVTYIDLTISYLHHKHIYLMVFSACILVFIVTPPILILTMYSTQLCDRLRSHLSPRLNLALLTFVNTYQGCYKDGTNGSRDYRALSGGFLALCLLMLAVSGGVNMLVEVNERSPVISWQTSIIMLVVLSVAFAVIRPYKLEIANHSAVSLAALLAVYAALLLYSDTAIIPKKYGVIVAGVVLLSLPHFVFYGYVLYQLGKLFKHSDTNLNAALEVLCCRVLRGQNERSALLTPA